MNWIEVGKFMVIAGLVILIIGLVFLISDKLPIGKLPGDFQFGHGRFKIYLPVATSILLSIVLTLVLNFFSRK
jgi:hypothetical protein